MERFFRFFGKEIAGLHQAAFLLASATVGAKILALLRDRLLASSFGAGKTLDIYYASFRIPDFFYVFSLFLVSATALIPIFLSKNRESLEKGRSFINSIFTVFFAVMVLLIIAGFFLIPCLTKFIAPGFSQEELGTLVKLSRILLLSPLLLGLSNLVSSIIQSFRRFLIYALSGILYNAGIIFGLIVFYPVFGINGVIFGVIAGALLHLSVQIPSLVRLGYFPVFTLNIAWSDIKKVVAFSFPRTLGLTLNQIVLAAITAMASLLAAGSIAVFNLAINLEAIPLGVIALSYGVAAFPGLAQKFFNNEKEKFFSDVLSAVRHLIFWLLPVSVMFIVLRAQIVRVVFGAGAFTWADTRLTAAALALLSISLFAEGLIYLLVRAFYAAGKTKIPLTVNIVSSLFIVFSSAALLYLFKTSALLGVFERILRVEAVPGTIMLALPLAYSLGVILNSLLLWIFFEKEFNHISARVKKSFFQVLLTSLAVGSVIYGGLNLFDKIFNINTFAGIFMQGILSGLLGILVGYAILKILKNEELNEITVSVKKRFPAGKVIVPEPEELP